MYVTGAYFRPAAAQSISQSSLCRFRSTSSPATLLSTTLLRCLAPSIAAAGYIQVEVTTNMQDFSTSGMQLRYVAVTIDSVTPSYVSQLGGTQVRIHSDGNPRPILRH